MLSTISDRIADFLCKHNDAFVSREVCSYGIELALYTLLSTIGLLLIGFLTNLVAETIIIIAIYYANQTVGGGFHASSHSKCFGVMLVGLMLCHVLLIMLPVPFLPLVMVTISTYILLANPVCLHKNKIYLMPKFTKIKHRSRLVVLLSIIISLCIFFLGKNESLRKSGCVGVFAASLSRTAAIIKQKYSNNSNSSITRR